MKLHQVHDAIREYFAAYHLLRVLGFTDEEVEPALVYRSTGAYQLVVQVTVDLDPQDIGDLGEASSRVFSATLAPAPWPPEEFNRKFLEAFACYHDRDTKPEERVEVWNRSQVSVASEKLIDALRERGFSFRNFPDPGAPPRFTSRVVEVNGKPVNGGAG